MSDSPLLSVQKAEASATTVLLIDAHEEDRQHWANRLKTSSHDYVVLEAATGAAGLAICQSQRIDCVVLELTLPDMSSFDILVKLVPRPSHPEMAVIILSRISLLPMAQLAKTNGAQAYLMKPHISVDDLHRAIRKAVASVGPTRKKPGC